jgi:hypothetical protein
VVHAIRPGQKLRDDPVQLGRHEFVEPQVREGVGSARTDCPWRVPAPPIRVSMPVPRTAIAARNCAPSPDTAPSATRRQPPWRSPSMTACRAAAPRPAACPSAGAGTTRPSDMSVTTTRTFSPARSGRSGVASSRPPVADRDRESLRRERERPGGRGRLRAVDGEWDGRHPHLFRHPHRTPEPRTVKWGSAGADRPGVRRPPRGPA